MLRAASCVCTGSVTSSEFYNMFYNWREGEGVQFWECMEREQDQKLLHKGSRDGALHPACLDSDWIK